MITISPPEKANSFCTVEEADTYHDFRMNNSEWINAFTEDKEKALKYASLKLSNIVEWIGDKISEDQALAFPRYIPRYFDNLTSVGFYYEFPLFLKNATAEYAFQLMRGETSSSQSDNIKSVSFSGMKMDFKDSGGKASLSDALPNEVFEMIRKYIKTTRPLVRC